MGDTSDSFMQRIIALVWGQADVRVAQVGVLAPAAAEFELYVEADVAQSAHATSAEKRAQSGDRGMRVSVVVEAVATCKVEFGDAERNQANLLAVRKRMHMLLKDASMRSVDIGLHIDLAVEAVFVPSSHRLQVMAITSSREVAARRAVMKRGIRGADGRSLPVYQATN
jgi:hypothetical protein